MLSAATTPTTPTTATDSATGQTNALSALPTQTLNQQDFLNLLVAQMTSQDPLNPVSNTDFASQLAQFSSLAAAQSTQTGVTNLQSGQQFLQADSLLGDTVLLAATTDASGMTTSTATGVVTGVQMNGSIPQITVNGQSYNLSQIISVSQN
jgi:flagellar basal-body rod modification protein FlgD